MSEKNLKYFEEKALQKSKKRESKKRPKMKVDGAKVKELYKIMNKK